VELRAGLDTEARGKTFSSAGYRTPGVQSVDIHYTESGTPARVDNIVDITKFHFWTRIVYMKLSQYSIWLRVGRPDNRGSIPGRGERIFSLTSASRPALGPTQFPVQ
jgi:hypothetical protein